MFFEVFFVFAREATRTINKPTRNTLDARTVKPTWCGIWGFRNNNHASMIALASINMTPRYLNNFFISSANAL